MSLIEKPGEASFCQFARTARCCSTRIIEVVIGVTGVFVGVCITDFAAAAGRAHECNAIGARSTGKSPVIDPQSIYENLRRTVLVQFAKIQRTNARCAAKMASLQVLASLA
jgi:hypothetical protein